MINDPGVDYPRMQSPPLKPLHADEPVTSCMLICALKPLITAATREVAAGWTAASQLPLGALGALYP